MLYLDELIELASQLCIRIKKWELERTFTQLYDEREITCIYYRKHDRQITLKCDTTYDIEALGTRIQRIFLTYDVKIEDKYERVLDREIYSDDYLWLILPAVIDGILLREAHQSRIGEYGKYYLLAEGNPFYGCENFTIIE